VDNVKMTRKGRENNRATRFTDNSWEHIRWRNNSGGYGYGLLGKFEKI